MPTFTYVLTAQDGDDAILTELECTAVALKSRAKKRSKEAVANARAWAEWFLGRPVVDDVEAVSVVLTLAG